MKITALTILAAITLTLGIANAGPVSNDKKTVVVQPTCVFRDTEFQIDGFYSAFVGSRGSRFGTGSGGGFGLNYFFARYFGVGYEFQAYSNRGAGQILPLSGNFFLRYPICSWHLAPYIMVGGGGSWSTKGGSGTGFGNVGGGLEYRITDHVGIFADGRYFYGGTGNVADIRGGVRYAF